MNVACGAAGTGSGDAGVDEKHNLKLLLSVLSFADTVRIYLVSAALWGNKSLLPPPAEKSA